MLCQNISMALGNGLKTWRWWVKAIVFVLQWILTKWDPPSAKETS